MNNAKNLSGLLEEIEKAKSNNSLIVVEGKKDKIALWELGLKNIFVLNETGKSIYEKIEEISDNKNSEIILLTDADKEGRKIYDLLKGKLAQMNVKMNNKMRDLMIKLKISHAEGLDSFIANQPK